MKNIITVLILGH